MNRFARWSFKGLTQKAVVLYERSLARITASEDRFAAALHDKTIEHKTRPMSAQERDRTMADPLSAFPSDVDYAVYDSAFIDPKLSAAQEYLSKQSADHVLSQAELEYLWTPARVSALRGDDMAARRASVNGKLWAAYVTMLQHAGAVSVDMLRSVVEKDVALLKLCPSVEEADEYNKDVPPDKVFNYRAEIVEIPAAHIEKLLKADRLLPLLREIAASSKLPSLIGAVYV